MGDSGGIGSGRRRTVLAFCFLVVVWGSSFPAIKVGLDHAPPLLFAGLRTLLGGVFIAAAAAVWGKDASPGRGMSGVLGMLGVLAVATALNVVFFIGFQTLAVMRLPSGSAAVLIYLQPILTGLLAWAFLGEALTPLKSVGLLLGFAGVVAVSSGSLSGGLSPVGVLLGVVSALSWAGGTVYFKRQQDGGSTRWFVAFMFLCGGLVLTLCGLAADPLSEISWSTGFAASLLYTSFAGIAMAWVLWLRLVSAGEASRVSAYIFFVPLVSVALGAVFLGEELSYSLILGAALIVTGIYLVNRRRAGKAS